MTFIGKVSNGAVALPPDAHWAEGDEVEVHLIVSRAKARTGRELAAIWAGESRLSPEEAESFARDVESGRSQLNRPPASQAWE